MAPAEADTGSGRDTRDEDWSIRVGSSSVSELPEAVASPAFDLAIGESCTRMVGAEADTGSGSTCGRRDTRDEDWSIRVGSSSVSESPVGVASPAFDLAIGESCTRMVATGADTGSGRDTRDEDWSIRVGITPVTELPVVVVSPAFDLAVSEHCTRMVRAGTDTGSVSTCGRGDTRDEDWSLRVGITPVSELPEAVVSPAFDLAICESCTRMQVAGGDTGSGRDTKDGDGRSFGGRITVTELTIIVVSPTFDLAIAKQRTRMVPVEADTGSGSGSTCGRGDTRDEDWSNRVGGGSVSELPEAVVSPAFDLATIY